MIDRSLDEPFRSSRKMFIEYDTKNEEQSTDMKTAIKNIHDKVGQLRLDFDQHKSRLQDV